MKAPTRSTNGRLQRIRVSPAVNARVGIGVIVGRGKLAVGTGFGVGAGADVIATGYLMLVGTAADVDLPHPVVNNNRPAKYGSVQDPRVVKILP